MAKRPTVYVPEVDPQTGMTIGSQSYAIAFELLEGGDSKREIIKRLRDLLPSETRSGGENPVAQKVHTVTRELLEKGFRIEQSYRLVPPPEGQEVKPKATGRPAKAKTAAKKPTKAVKKVAKPSAT